MVVCSCRRSRMYNSRSTVPKRSTAASAAKHTGARGRGVEGEDARTSGTGPSSHGLKQCAGWGAVGPSQWCWSVPGGWHANTVIACTQRHLGGPARTDMSCWGCCRGPPTARVYHAPLPKTNNHPPPPARPGSPPVSKPSRCVSSVDELRACCTDASVRLGSTLSRKTSLAACTGGRGCGGGGGQLSAQQSTRICCHCQPV